VKKSEKKRCKPWQPGVTYTNIQCAMPNKRDPEKVQVGFWVSPKEKAELADLARRLNTNMSELLRSLVERQAHPVRKKPD
jgi:hypothetical protein